MCHVYQSASKNKMEKLMNVRKVYDSLLSRVSISYIKSYSSIHFFCGFTIVILMSNIDKPSFAGISLKVREDHGLTFVMLPSRAELLVHFQWGEVCQEQPPIHAPSCRIYKFS